MVAIAVTSVQQAIAAANLEGTTLTLDHVAADALGNFSVVLTLQGETLALQSADAFTGDPNQSSPDASFEPDTGILNIHSLQFGADSYHVLLQLNESQTQFNILSFVPLNTTLIDAPGKNLLNTSSPLGANIAPFQAWTPGWVLIDAFPKTQPWVSNDCDSEVWNSGPALELDSKGWVASLPDDICADTSVFASQPGHYPEGTYVLLWEGDGEVQLRWDVEPPVSSATAEVTQADGLQRMTFQVLAENQSNLGIGIRIAELGSDPLRNIRMIPPGGLCGVSESELDYFAYCATARGGEGMCPVDQQCFDFEQVYWDRFRDDSAAMNAPKPVFHPLYASTYQQYRAIRFMKWLRPEDSLDAAWEDRILIDEQPFTTDEEGIPIEYALAFANLINADAWLNVPAAATDDYNLQFAELVNNQLNPALNFYLEYANEIFNTDQAVPYYYALEQANLTSSIPGSDSDLVKVAKYAGLRSAQIFSLWRENLDNPSRMIAVLVGFNPLSEFTLNVLDFNNAWQQADALAINGYIGPHRGFTNSQAAFDSLTLEQLLQELDDGSVLNDGTSLVDLAAQYEQHATYAEDRGLALIAYEGNNFMVTTGAPDNIVEVFFAANRDQRLGERFVTNLENFRDAGGSSFFHFLNEDLWDSNGAFGARQFQDQSRVEVPVFDTLMDFIETNSCWWPGCLIPNPP